MGTLVGHVAPGFGFLLIGLWHLFNHTKLHALRPNSYVAPPWFPSPVLRYLEPILIMAGSCASIAMELFIGPENHQPLDDDGTIPSNHLHNFEHASISLTFLVYGAFAIVLDRTRPPAPARVALTQVVGAVAFAQQLLLFHLHSADHMGMEGQYHWLLQLVIFVSLSTTLLGIGYPRSFTIAFVRSASIAFQGLWFIAMGYALWTPSLIPKGCFINPEEGHQVVRCHDGPSLDRAKSLVNILFSWFLAGFAILIISFYLFMVKKFPEEPEYLPLVKGEGEEDDLESQKKLEDLQSFVHVGKGMRSIELER